MITVHVSLKGLSPILLHNPAGMGGNGKVGKGRIPTPEEEAAAGCYWTEDKSSLAIPSTNILRCFTKAGAQFKVKMGAAKTTMAKVIPSAVSIEPIECVPFGTKEYSIDTRRAVVQKQGILRSRPKLNPWTLKFDLLVIDEDIPRDMIPALRLVVEDSGRRVGLGDFRIEKTGPFGKFAVESWEVEQ